MIRLKINLMWNIRLFKFNIYSKIFSKIIKLFLKIMNNKSFQKYQFINIIKIISKNNE